MRGRGDEGKVREKGEERGEVAHGLFACARGEKRDENIVEGM